MQVEPFSLSPSILSRKMMCLAFEPAPFDPTTRLRFLGLHAMAAVATIKRHIALRYRLRSIEKSSKGFRVDLLFDTPTGKIRLVEVKSGSNIRNIHCIQAALYWKPGIDELVVSNQRTDQLVTSQFIMEVAEKAEITLKLLESDPQTAATTFTPNSDCCYICANAACPWLPLARKGRIP